jgi:hypothetical protein
VTNRAFNAAAAAVHAVTACRTCGEKLEMH